MMSRRRASRPTWNGKTLAAILLDLDGTLLDTVDDIALALNRALAEQCVYRVIVRFAGHAARRIACVELTFPNYLTSGALNGPHFATPIAGSCR